MTIEKINDTTFRETINQDPMIKEDTLDSVLSSLEEVNTGIKNNENQLVFLGEEKIRLEALIDQLRGLGLKTQEEINLENQEEQE